ncbi:hypothetical protein V7114_20780 [Neobacillus niacini]|uniref:hypothetical protein n=1 Tax=Neobacillus niacini TaxID=86668 RepID=UPI002FFE38A8
MKVQTIKELRTLIGTIPVGVQFNVKELYPGGETFFVVDGHFKGIGLPGYAVHELPEEKTYSEKEVENIKEYWFKEVKTLKFFVNTLVDCLILASEEIDRLRKDLEKAQ